MGYRYDAMVTEFHGWPVRDGFFEPASVCPIDHSFVAVHVCRLVSAVSAGNGLHDVYHFPHSFAQHMETKPGESNLFSSEAKAGFQNLSPKDPVPTKKNAQFFQMPILPYNASRPKGAWAHGY